MLTNSAGTEIRSSVVEAIGPAQEPVTLEEARTHCRVTSTDDDFTLQTLIMAAREWAESYTNRKLITQAWDWRMDEFPATPAEIPLVPVQSITSISYSDEAGDAQTLDESAYELDSASQPARLNAGTDGWPAVGTGLNQVTVRFVTGYGLAAKVGQIFKLAMLFHIEAHYDRDERTFKMLIEAAENLLKPHIYHRIV